MESGVGQEDAREQLKTAQAKSLGARHRRLVADKQGFQFKGIHVT